MSATGAGKMGGDRGGGLQAPGEVCVHARAYTCKHACMQFACVWTRVCTCVCIYTHMCACMCECDACMNVHMHACRRTCVPVCTCVPVGTRACTHMYVCMHACMPVHACAPLCMCTAACTCTCAGLSMCEGRGHVCGWAAWTRSHQLWVCTSALPPEICVASGGDSNSLGSGSPSVEWGC